MSLLNETIEISKSNKNFSEQQANETQSSDCIQMETQICNEKRTRTESDGVDEFKEVRYKRRAVRKFQQDFNDNLDEEISKYYEVNVTSQQILLKQIAFAKLMREENIENITNIKYKNPYKLIVSFENKESAEKLLNCQKLQELQYRCMPRDESLICFGVVKQIEVDIKEEELKENFQSDYEIVSIKRLKCLDIENTWIDSEAIRVGFKNNEIPQHVYAFGCRFKVHPYTYPVTQCAKCWKYGHLARACTIKKSICPRCGDNHLDCNTTDYKCCNCKGSHKAFDKTCKMFLKEKEIRLIMKTDNSTYKQALNKYLQNHKHTQIIIPTFEDEADNHNIQISETTTTSTTNNVPTYRDIVVTQASIHTKDNNLLDIEHTQKENVTKANTKTSQKTKSNIPIRKKKGQTINNNMEMDLEMVEQENGDFESSEPQQSEDKKTKLNFKRYFDRFKTVCSSEGNIEDKIMSVLKIIFEEIITFFTDMINTKDFISKFFSFFVNG